MRAQVTEWVVRQESAPIMVAVPAPAIALAPPRWASAHPRAWLGAALVLALLAAGVGVLRLTAPSPATIRTVAGSACAYSSDCYGGDNQKAVSAQLARPTSVAVDSKGTSYIADYGNQRIRKVMDGGITTVAGGGKKPPRDDGLGICLALSSPGLGRTDAGG